MQKEKKKGVKVKIAKGPHIQNRNKTKAHQGKTFITMKRKDLRKQELDVLIIEISEWISSLLNISINPQNLWTDLDSGIILCDLLAKIDSEIAFKYSKDAAIGSFFARDNIAKFIKYTEESFGVRTVQLFETNDLICRTNLYKVATCILALSRIAFEKYNITPPGIVSLEIEIDSLKKKDLDDSETVKNHINTIISENSSRFDGDSNIWENYPVVKGDIIDELVAKNIKTHKITLPIQRISAGEYIFGSNMTKQYLRIVRNLLLVRTASGWQRFVPFVLEEQTRQNKAKIAISSVPSQAILNSVDDSQGTAGDIEEKLQSTSIGFASNENDMEWMLIVSEGDELYEKGITKDISTDLGEYKSCIATYEKALQVLENTDDKKSMIDVLFNLGKVYQALGLYRQSLESYLRSSALCEEYDIDNPGENASIALIKEYMKDPSKAITHLNELIEHHKETNNVYAIACVHQALGNAYQSIGELEPALDNFGKSLIMFTEQGHTLEISQVHHGLGNAYKEAGDVDKALEHYELSRNKELSL